MTANSIGASVGNNGSNRDADVAVVQLLLNNVPPSQGGANPELVKDGLCGPKTIKAIGQFQKNQFGWQDGLVEPGKRTINTLNKLQPVITPATPPCGCPRGPALPIRPNDLEKFKRTGFHLGVHHAAPFKGKSNEVTVHEPGSDSSDARSEVYVADIPPAPRPLVGPPSAKEAAVQNGPTALMWVRSATVALRRLIECGGNTDKIARSPAFPILNRHFHLTLADLKPTTLLGFPTNNPRNFILHNIEKIYNFAAIAIQRSAKETVWVSSPAEGGDINNTSFVPIPLDGFIHVTPLYLRLGPLHGVLTVVHEMVHYVTENRVFDVLYRRERPDEYDTQSSSDALRCADTYAYFAFHCHSGSSRILENSD
jgi:hypothetical protein